MQTRQRCITKPEREAVRRAETAERRADRAEALAAARDDAPRLEAALAEMREDRDRWRAQAERLAAALDRLKSQPVPSVAAEPPPADDVLNGFEAIGRHLGITEDAARGRALREGMPIVRSSRRVWIRRSTLNAWIAEREAAATQGDR